MRRFAKIKIFALALVFVGLAAVISFAQSPDPKEETAKLEQGVYYWTGIAWQPMEPVTWSANGVKKAGKSSVWIYRHPEARIQLTGGRPLFCYKFMEVAPESPYPSSFVIARLDQKKDYRQLETPSDTGAFTFKAGSSKGRMLDITVTDVTRGVILISPKEPLLPGEYVLGGSSLAITGYDFGFHSANSRDVVEKSSLNSTSWYLGLFPDHFRKHGWCPPGAGILSRECLPSLPQ
jgi:hypothetical protein